jgi:hypothetical protein
MNDRLRAGRAPVGRRADVEALESRFALRIAARLSEDVDALPHDVGERLRVARERALEHARAMRPAAVHAATTPLAASAVGTAVLGTGGGSQGRSPWWFRLASALPLVALVGGLMLIQHQHVNQQIAAAAEIDADLLTDPLPPTAYSDAGPRFGGPSPRNRQGCGSLRNSTKPASL